MLELTVPCYQCALCNCLLRSTGWETQPAREVVAVLEAASVRLCKFLESGVTSLDVLFFGVPGDF